MNYLNILKILMGSFLCLFISLSSNLSEAAGNDFVLPLITLFTLYTGAQLAYSLYNVSISQSSDAGDTEMEMFSIFCGLTTRANSIDLSFSHTTP